MRRFDRLLTSLNSLVDTHGNILFLDLGSTMTKLALNQEVPQTIPTSLVRHVPTRSIVVIGEKAKQFNTEANRDCIHELLIKRGMVTSVETVAAFLQAVIARSLKEKPQHLFARLRGFCTLPSSTTPVERYIFERMLKQIDVGRWTLVKKADCYAKLCEQSSDGGVIDIGAETTEVVLCHQGAVESVTIPWGVGQFVSVIQATIRSQFGCSISDITAQKLLRQLQSSSTFWQSTDLTANKQEFFVTVRGKQLNTGVPTTMTVDLGACTPALQTLIQELVQDIQLFLSQLPTGVVTASLDQGLLLGGGGALIAGLSDYFAQVLGCTVTITKSPELLCITALRQFAV